MARPGFVSHDETHVLSHVLERDIGAAALHTLTRPDTGTAVAILNRG
jgi:hypothetical protein